MDGSTGRSSASACPADAIIRTTAQPSAIEVTPSVRRKCIEFLLEAGWECRAPRRTVRRREQPVAIGAAEPTRTESVGGEVGSRNDRLPVAGGLWERFSRTRALKRDERHIDPGNRFT